MLFSYNPFNAVDLLADADISATESYLNLSVLKTEASLCG